MNRRKLLYLCLIVGILIPLSIYSGVIDFGRSKFSEYQYRRIRIGMTEEQVEEILGAPGDYGSSPATGERTSVRNLFTCIAKRGKPVEDGRGDVKHWVDYEYKISIGFDEEQRVVGTMISRSLFFGH